MTNKNTLFQDLVCTDSCDISAQENNKWELYSKNEYSPSVKTSNWWYHREGYPKDYDDLQHAAYKRLGTSKEDESHWVTETKESMETGRGDPRTIAMAKKSKPKKILGFLSYPLSLKTRSDISPEEIKKVLPSFPKEELHLRYTTTNQAHYKKIHINSI